MKSKGLILGFFLCCFALNVKALSSSEDDVFKILPSPQSIEKKAGEGFLWNELSYIVISPDTAWPVLGDMLSRLPRYVKEGKGVRLELTEKEVPESVEGYVLETATSGVVIKAKTRTGLFYGCQTLEQLLEDSRDFRAFVPSMKIVDYPTLTYRAVHFDTKHHLSRMEYYYRVIDKLARYKINAVIWEIEDKLRFTRRPEISAPNAISKDEMRALSRYAKERNVSISPLVQGLGHAGFILKHHWTLRENPESDWEFCPSEPQTYELQFDLYRDALEAMPDGKYLHVGGDEITAIGIDERCKATGKNAFELQMGWLKRVCDFALQHGRTPIFWDDMPLKHGEIWPLIQRDIEGDELEKVWDTKKLDAAIHLFPKECIYMRWSYEDATLPAHRKLLEWYRSRGLKVMAATAASAGDSPFLPREHTRSGFIKGFSKLAAENNLVGILATAWDDGSPHWETVMRGFIAQGEYAWNPNARSLEEFMAAHAQREFGFSSSEQQMRFLDELEQAAFFFDGALVSSGRRNPAWGVKEFRLIDLPDKKHPGEWSLKYRGKLDSARVEKHRYLKIAEGLSQAKRCALRNRYTLDVYEQLSHLFDYPVRLLLALEQYDTAQTVSLRQEALKEVKDVCDSFQMLRDELEQVYSRTRFMKMPDGYISDHNHHNHLAALTPNNDWLYWFEIPMNKKIKTWYSLQLK